MYIPPLAQTRPGVRYAQFAAMRDMHVQDQSRSSGWIRTLITCVIPVLQDVRHRLSHVRPWSLSRSQRRDLLHKLNLFRNNGVECPNAANLASKSKYRWRRISHIHSLQSGPKAERTAGSATSYRACLLVRLARIFLAASSASWTLVNRDSCYRQASFTPRRLR